MAVKAGNGVRILFIFTAPLVALLLSSWALCTFTTATSLFGALLDAYRAHKRCLPFPVFLLLFYAMQASVWVTLSHTLHAWSSKEAEGAAKRLALLGANDVSRPETLDSAPRYRGGRVVTMTIVMAAHGEHNYLKRTLDSIYEATPSSILKEIIVVDDGSTPPLAPLLSDYPQVRTLRHEQRLGLVKSKMEGGNAATGDMIMFLDAHVKPEMGWAEPLLRHMNVNYKRVVVPLIPILDPETWEVNSNAVGVKMMFDWTLFFQWFEDGNNLVPCMSGGLFGITREWWHESGEYDYDMKMWGAENIEQSLRIWLCGGEIYVARDSRVGHVFRPRFPYKINNTEIYINKVRTVETWFDEYKQRYYEADPAANRYKPLMGNISSRKALRDRLRCKPFKWYVDKFRDIFHSKHMLPEADFLMRNRETDRCLGVAGSATVREEPCNTDASSQRWTYGAMDSSIKNLGLGRCLEVDSQVASPANTKVLLRDCSRSSHQVWKFKQGLLKWHSYCAKADGEGMLVLGSCSLLRTSGPYEKFAMHSPDL